MLSTLVNQIHSMMALSTAIFLIIVCIQPESRAKPVNKATENEKPVIGAMTQAVTDPDQMKYGNIYLPANYVKYLESAGARVAPVLINQTDAYYTAMYQALNGLLLPGGSSVHPLQSGLGQAALFLYQHSIKGFHSSGDHFPLWGTCEGFQLLTMLTSQKDLLTNTDTGDKALALTLSKDYQQSRMFGPNSMPDDILHILTTENVTYNAHHMSLTPKNYSSNSALAKFYRVISTNRDDSGIEFISTMEAFKYPIYGTQWHPEKNLFQWTDGHIPHDMDAVRVAQHMADFFVEQARKSSHKFRTEDEEAQHLIYNKDPVNIGNHRDGEQYYFWTV